MGIPTTNGINTNAPYPTDLKTKVGTGMQYASAGVIPSAYTYNDMQIDDVDTHISYKYIISGGIGSLVNISFGATIMAFNAAGASLKLNNGDIQVATGTTVTFQALTFGNITNTDWEISINNTTYATSEKPSFTSIFANSGNATIQLTLTDYFGNEEIVTANIRIVAAGTVDISGFTVTPALGFNDSTYQFDFTANFGYDIPVANISDLTISWNDGELNEVSLVNAFGYLPEVTWSEGVMSVTNLSSLLLQLNTTTTFTLSVDLSNGDTGSSITIYTAKNRIEISSFTVENSIVDGEEFIEVTSTLSSWITGDVVTGEVTCSDTSIPTETITFSSSTWSYSFSTILLQSQISFTLSTAHTLNSTVVPYINSDSSTVVINPSYTALEFTNFEVSPDTALVGTTQSTTFIGYANKSLEGVVITIFENGGAKYYPAETTLNYVTYTTNITYTEDKTFYMSGTEIGPYGAYSVDSIEDIVIINTPSVGDPIFINSHYDLLEVPQDERLWPESLVYEDTEEEVEGETITTLGLRSLITNDMIIASPTYSDVSIVTPQFIFPSELKYGNRFIWWWVALPESIFPIYYDFFDDQWNIDGVVNEFFTDVEGDVNRITLTIDGESKNYRWYLRNRVSYPGTFKLGNI